MSIQQELAKRRAALTPEQQALLKKRLRHEIVLEQPALTIPPRPDQESAPVSLTQQRVWFLEQLEPGSAAYHIPLALQVHGPIHLPILQNCLDEIVRRHEALRTTFEQRDGQPVQRIAPTMPIELSLTEAQPDVEARQQVEQFIQHETQQPFNLATGPLLRVSLLRIAPQEHILVIVLHHIISDFWSVTIFFEEFITLYKASLLGTPALLPQLPVQYADYAYWQRNLLPDEALEQSLHYWQEQLAEAPPAVSLPPNRPLLTTPTYQGGTHFFTIAADLKERIRAFCQHETVTNFMVLLAALQVTLARYSGANDLIIGSSSANRSVPEVEKLIGFFANTLVFRANLADNPTIHELVQRTRKITLDGQKHQNVPFERTLPPERDLQRNPLFQVMLILQNIATATASFSEVTFEGIEVERDDAKFDLLLNVQELPQELSCYIEYNAGLFSAAFIAQFQEHLLGVLSHFCTHPETRIQDIPLLSEAERTRLLSTWNQTEAPFPETLCLHELFTLQAERTPTAIALQDGAYTLSYQQLDAQANQLALLLQTHGVGPDVLVGLCLPRSIQQFIGLLAILKAGGAYVPLDPTMPAERLEYLLTDAHISLVLTQDAFQAQLKGPGRELLCVSIQDEPIAQTPISNACPLNLAYVIYTSGSTGHPKGVLISHRNVVNHSTAIARQYQFSTQDRVLQFSSLSFDAAVEEIFPTWLSGATLVLRPSELPTFEQFLAWVEQQQISVLDLPTAYWHVWIQEMERHAQSLPASLRLVIIGGEKAESERWHQWQHLVGASILLSNTYGPTETTVTATLYDAPARPSDDALPIGQPLANVQSYVLDTNRQPVPIEVRGELYLGGAGVARGYLDRPDLTAERFVPDPFSERSGSRMYRTGDRVYRRTDGELVYVEREDQQVKIRGFRIELGEIEQALLRQSSIREALVLLREDQPGRPQLVAYLTLQPDTAYDATAVLQALKAFLPEYMLPSAFVVLENFPLTVSGKIDRRALPTADQQEGDATAYVAPETELEEVLVDIWRGVLGQEQIGIHHNFFALGGHSLLATQLLARVYEAFEIELSLRQFFDTATIASMAVLLLEDGETRERVETTAHLLLSIADLSEEEVEAMLNA